MPPSKHGKNLFKLCKVEKSVGLVRKPKAFKYVESTKYHLIKYQNTIIKIVYFKIKNYIKMKLLVFSL